MAGNRKVITWYSKEIEKLAVCAIIEEKRD